MTEPSNGPDFGSFARGISFRSVQPLEEPEVRTRFVQPDGRIVDVLNTVLPFEEDAIKLALQDICRLPRLATFAMGAMINYAVARMPSDQSYVNVGVWHGFSFFAGMARNPDKVCIGVDSFSGEGFFYDGMNPREAFLRSFGKLRSPSHQFFEMDFHDYFARTHSGPIGVYFLDAAHDYETQLRGLQIAEPFFAPRCDVIVDDTNWPEARQATLDFLAGSKNRYEMVLDQPTLGRGHPTFGNGVMAFERVA